MNDILKANIIAHLEQKGNYSEEVDLYLVNELLLNIDLSNQCLERINLPDGVIQEYEYKPGHTVSRINPAVNAYQMFQRNIGQLSTKLGINRNDRIKMKLIEQKIQDDFDESN